MRCGYAADWQLADDRKNICLQEALDLTGVRRRLSHPFLRDPFPSYCLECVGGVGCLRKLLLFSVMRWVEALLDQGTRVVASAPGIVKANVPSACFVVAVFAERKDVLFAFDPIAVAPKLRSARANLEIQPVTVCEFDGFRPWLRVADFCVSEWQDADILG
jgi:hypothetical protein